MRKKKQLFWYSMVLKLMMDILVGWEAYDLYKAHNKNLAIALIVVYAIIRIWWLIRTICRNKLRREFNELFPE